MVSVSMLNSGSLPLRHTGCAAGDVRVPSLERMVHTKILESLTFSREDT